jgi:hypothetical protein
MASLSRKTPTPREQPAEIPFRRTYSAVIRSDGSVLPIEERLGRRLLRTLPPDSTEGRQLLRRDCVSLLTADGRSLAGLSTGEVYDRLRAMTAQRLAENPRDPDWRRRCKDTLLTIDRWRKALARDH